MSETVERFSNRVENYVKYRPGYPPEVLELFQNEMGLTPDSTVADVGSGTGLSSKIFLENGGAVYCVEPNAKMRDAAAEFLKDFTGFRGVDGSAENTTLPDDSVDFAVAAQAFHWFDAERTSVEFRRILKPGGWIGLLWNARQLDTTPFLREYEEFLIEFANDYTKVRHENVDEEKLERFFQRDFRRASFPNVQVFDFDGLKGRVASSSYMPSEDDETFPAMTKELETLFAKHAENDRISVLYDTNVFYAKY